MDGCALRDHGRDARCCPCLPIKLPKRERRGAVHIHEKQWLARFEPSNFDDLTFGGDAVYRGGEQSGRDGPAWKRSRSSAVWALRIALGTTAI